MTETIVVARQISTVGAKASATASHARRCVGLSARNSAFTGVGWTPARATSGTGTDGVGGATGPGKAANDGNSSRPGIFSVAAELSNANPSSWRAPAPPSGRRPPPAGGSAPTVVVHYLPAGRGDGVDHDAGAIVAADLPHVLHASPTASASDPASCRVAESGPHVGERQRAELLRLDAAAGAELRPDTA